MTQEFRQVLMLAAGGATGYSLAENCAEIEWDKVATAEVYNELKRGELKVIKTSEDNFVEGMRFHLYGTSLSGEKVSVYAYTDKNGVAVFEDILIGENYTVEEVNTAIRYVIPESQGAVIEWNKVTEVKFHNVLKKWRADVFKLDADLAGFDDDDDSGLVPVELMPMVLSLDSDAMVDDLGGIYGQSQGDATLEGAVYGVFKDGALIDTYTTDKNGYFLTDYYPCYENVEWTIREISPSEGYLLDETVYYIDTYAGQYTVELNTVYPDVYEDIINERRCDLLRGQHLPRGGSVRKVRRQAGRHGRHRRGLPVRNA